MSNLDNKLNINKVAPAYAPVVKKEEEPKTEVKAEEIKPEVVNDGSKAAEAYGRSLVKQAGKVENPEMVQNVKDAVDFYVKNPGVAAASVKAGDDSYEMLKAQGAHDAYEKSCCGSCDAANKAIEKK